MLRSMFQVACVLMLITSVVLVVWVARPLSDTDQYATPADIVATALRLISLVRCSTPWHYSRPALVWNPQVLVFWSGSYMYLLGT